MKIPNDAVYLLAEVAGNHASECSGEERLITLSPLYAQFIDNLRQFEDFDEARFKAALGLR